MSEIRDEVLEDLLSIKGMTPDMLKAVFTHPNIAIVDRDAKPPHCPVVMEGKLSPEVADFRQYTINQYYLTQSIMTKAGWLKEIKDGPSSK